MSAPLSRASDRHPSDGFGKLSHIQAGGEDSVGNPLSRLGWSSESSSFSSIPTSARLGSPAASARTPPIERRLPLRRLASGGSAEQASGYSGGRDDGHVTIPDIVTGPGHDGGGPGPKWAPMRPLSRRRRGPAPGSGGGASRARLSRREVTAAVAARGRPGPPPPRRSAGPGRPEARIRLDSNFTIIFSGSSDLDAVWPGRTG